MIHEELSGTIIGAAMEMLNELKPGLDEKLYERAMIIELKHRGHSVSVQSSFPVSYRGELIGNLIPDLIVDDAVIVDPKVVSCFTDTHVAQMIGYLNITSLEFARYLPESFFIGDGQPGPMQDKRSTRRQQRKLAWTASIPFPMTPITGNCRVTSIDTIPRWTSSKTN